MRSLSRRRKVYTFFRGIFTFFRGFSTTFRVGRLRHLRSSQAEGRVGAACAPHRPYARGAMQIGYSSLTILRVRN